MTVKFVGKVIKVDGTLAIIIPAKYVHELGIVEGDDVILFVSPLSEKKISHSKKSS